MPGCFGGWVKVSPANKMVHEKDKKQKKVLTGKLGMPGL